jgi:hypothetical protein
MSTLGNSVADQACLAFSAARIPFEFSRHSLVQARRRGISAVTLSLLLSHYDRSRKVPGLCRALWVSRKRRAALIRSGIPPADVDRLAGVRLIVGLQDDTIRTVEHTTTRRHWV